MHVFRRLRTYAFALSTLAITPALAASSLTVPAAIVSGGALGVPGSSRIDVRWGSVLAAGDLEIQDFELNAASPTHLDIYAGQKAIGAGVDYSDVTGKDLWLRWRCSGSLLGADGATRVFPISGIGGVPVTDLYSQLMNGAFAGYNASNTFLVGRYHPLTLAEGEGILFDTPIAGVYPVGTGALVQGVPGVATEVDNVIARFGYDTWKQIAINRGFYLRPNGVNPTCFLDAQGNPLILPQRGHAFPVPLRPDAWGNTSVTAVAQLTMKALIGPDGNSNLMPDRVLFIDTVEGTENGTSANVDVGTGFFWKGLLYSCANLSIESADATSVFMKDPNQYALSPTDTTHGRLVSDCRIDGVLVNRGNVEIVGRPMIIYGSYIACNGSTGEVMPTVYYNSRLSTAGLMLPGAAGDFVSVQSGDWYEPATWGGSSVPDIGSNVTISAGHTVVFRGSTWDLRGIHIYGRFEAPGADLGFTDGTLCTYPGCEHNLDATNLHFSGGSVFLSWNPDLPYPGRPNLYIHRGDLQYNTMGVETDWMGFDVARIQDAEVYFSSETYISVLELWGTAKTSGSVPSTVYYYEGVFVPGFEWAVIIDWILGFRASYYVGHGATVDMTQNYIAGSRIPVIEVQHGGKLITPYASNWGVGTMRVYGDVFHNGQILPGQYQDSLATVDIGPGGTFTTTQTLSAPGSYSFPYCGVSTDFQSLGTATKVTVTRHGGAAPNAPPSIASTNTYWDISADGTGCNATLKLARNGATDPYVCRYTGTGESWVPARSRFDATNVELDNVTGFSRWAVGDAALGSVPVAVSGWGLE